MKRRSFPIVLGLGGLFCSVAVASLTACKILVGLPDPVSDAGLDGAAPDAGDEDGSTNAAVDDGGTDGGHDAGVYDAGAHDAGGDAGYDAGPQPNSIQIPLFGCGSDAIQPPTAPNGYYVNGNTVCSPQSTPHLFHGVARPSMEWNYQGERISLSDFQLMATWHANVVRIALNQDYWLNDKTNTHYQPTYATNVDQAIAWAHQAGLDVIIDLHWSDLGTYTTTAAQQRMADAHSVMFWQDVASRYKDDGRVIFELYNEPHDVPTAVWLNGGTASGSTWVGMQQLYDTVRGTGAKNLVIVGGLNWAYDLSFVPQSPVKGYNILYAAHPYNNSPSRADYTWEAKFGFLAASLPIILTEFGDNTTGRCDPSWDAELIPYMDRHHISWTAWAWYATADCKFPPVISSWDGTPTAPGAVVKAALLSYTDWQPAPAVDGPDGGSDGGGGDGDAGDAGGDGG